MKYLVTGGAGMIGSALVERLEQDTLTEKVYVYDNLSTGKIENLTNNCEHIKELEKCPKVDVVFHLGMPSSSPMYKENPLLFSQAMDMVIRVLEFAHKSNAKLVYASTSSIYNGNAPPFKESMPIHVTDYYTEIRYYLERMAKLYHDKKGLESTGLRFFSVYGRNDYKKGRFANVVTQFALEMLKGKRPLIFGDGEQRRDFIHVDDVVFALRQSAKLGGYNILNVGTGASDSFNDVVEMINKRYNLDIKPEYTDNPIHNYVFDTLADTTKIRSKMYWRPKGFRINFHKYLDHLKEVVK